MMRHLAWTLTAALALGACGAGDRKQEESVPVANPAATAPRPAPAPEPAPPPVAIEEPAVVTTTVQPTERLYTVQIAAYLSADSAQNLADRLTTRGLPVWTMEVRHGNQTYHRIRVGAHPGLREMRTLGQQISAQYKQNVWVAPVDMSAQIPATAVAETRALLAR